MAAPPPPRSSGQPSSKPTGDELQRPGPFALQNPSNAPNTSTATLRPDGSAAPRKKRNHRGGKKKRNRRQSFAASTEDGSGIPEILQSRRSGQGQSAARSSFYRLQGQNLSNTSLESEALLDHR